MNRHYKDRQLLTGRNSSPPSKAVHDFVRARDKGVCVYCGSPANVLDHVLRWADGAPSISSNLVCACQKCNTYKGKHPKGLKHLTRAIFWLLTKGENLSWMNDFYPTIEANLKKQSVEYRFEQIEKEKRKKETTWKSSKSRPSKITKAVALRLSNDVYGVVERRANRRGIKISEYIKLAITIDARRKR